MVHQPRSTPTDCAPTGSISLINILYVYEQSLYIIQCSSRLLIGGMVLPGQTSQQRVFPAFLRGSTRPPPHGPMVSPPRAAKQPSHRVGLKGEKKRVQNHSRTTKVCVKRTANPNRTSPHTQQLLLICMSQHPHLTHNMHVKAIPTVVLGRCAALCFSVLRFCFFSYAST